MKKVIIRKTGGVKNQQKIEAYMMYMNLQNLSEAILQREMLSLRLQIFQKDFKYAKHSLLNSIIV